MVHYDGTNGGDAVVIWDSVMLNPGANSWTLTVDGSFRARKEATE